MFFGEAAPYHFTFVIQWYFITLYVYDICKDLKDSFLDDVDLYIQTFVNQRYYITLHVYDIRKNILRANLFFILNAYITIFIKLNHGEQHGNKKLLYDIT